VIGYALSSLVAVAILFVGMVVIGEVGRRVALRRASRDPEGAWEGVGVVDGAVFALLGLIIAFAFSGAILRFDVRRNLVVDEANAIGTAYLRLQLLPESSRPELRDKFRQYLDSRLTTYRLLPDVEAARTEFAKSQKLQNEIWTEALAAAHDMQPATMLLVPALNEMFDITMTRTMNALYMHPPGIVLAMLFGLALVGSLLAGYGMARARGPHWLHLVLFAAATSFVIYVILDTEYPRLGLIRVDAVDQALVDLRDSMK